MNINSCKNVQFGVHKSRLAFSLVEMLMALLVASLLMAALAPVMIKKSKENVSLTGEVNAPKLKKHEINYLSTECQNIITDTDGSQYCEGTFTVPPGLNGSMYITVIGAGGGGAAASTAGYVEYTTVSDTHAFKVPLGVAEIEATLVSGGAGGGAGGSVVVDNTYVITGSGALSYADTNTVSVTTAGTGNLPTTTALNNANVIISACGGGGGGAARPAYATINPSYYSHPGNGAYFTNRVFQLPANGSNLPFMIAGAGQGMGVDYVTLVGSIVSNGGGGGRYADQGCAAGAGGAGGQGDGATGVSTCCGQVVASCINAGGTAPSGAGAGGRGGTGENPYAWGCYSAGGGSGSRSGYGGYGATGGHSTSGGGGGGGSTWLGVNLASGTPVFQVGGGGGGTGQSSDFQSIAARFVAGPGGGGGAGQSGYTGGDGAAPFLGSANMVIKASNGGGGDVATVFGNNYCKGGITSDGAIAGTSGKNGAMRIKFLDYGPGGSGGGSGIIIPIRAEKVVPDESLTIKIGRGGSGGAKGEITSAGAIVTPSYGHPSYVTDRAERASQLKRGATMLLQTPQTDWSGSYGGHPTGRVQGSPSGNWQIDQAGIEGNVTDGKSGWAGGQLTYVTVAGFTSRPGYAAGDRAETGAINYPNGISGGRGGWTTLFGNTYCSGGTAGTSASVNGGSPGSYGGCGGGGAFGLATGGNGGMGYGRISWNKKWDAAVQRYVLTKGSTGGGGASGNVLKYKIEVKSGEVIKIRIGKGGISGYVTNNTFVSAKNGGATVFGDLKAGGGSPGLSPTVEGALPNTLAKVGLGGGVSPICKVGSTDYFNNSAYCTKGIVGENGKDALGGSGGSILPYGTGGNGGANDTGDASNGNLAVGAGAGGGGASIRDIGKVDANQTTSNLTKGGDGANGKILIEWYE